MNCFQLLLVLVILGAWLTVCLVLQLLLLFLFFPSSSLSFESMSNSSVSPSSGGISNSSLSFFLAVTADFYNAFLNLFSISSNFSSGIIIYSAFLGLSSGFTLFDIVTTSAISFLKNSPALYITFLEAVFKEPSPVFNNY